MDLQYLHVNVLYSIFVNLILFISTIFWKFRNFTFGQFVREGDFDALDMEVPANPLMEFEINSKKPLDVGFPTQISNFAPERWREGVQRDLHGEGRRDFVEYQR